MAYTVVRGDTMGAIAKKLGVSLSALAAANPQIANINRISPGMTINSPGGGGGGAGAPAGGLSMEEAMSAYGFVYTLAEAVPDLKAILDQAISGKWTAEKLTATVESSNWWKTNADTVRNLVTQQHTDPSTYTRNVANAVELVKLKASQMGRELSDEWANTLALRTLTENASWDDQRLSQLLATTTGIIKGESGAYIGEAARLGEHMTQVAQNYGVAYTRDWLDTWVNEIESGRNSLDGFEQVMRARAKAAFPQFAAQIDAGLTVRDIADPYISTYAQTLEIPETEVKLDDSFIQRALSQSGPDGTTRTAMPLWQFQRQLKDDPRYDKTLQARQDAYDALGKIGAAFGFYTGSN